MAGTRLLVQNHGSLKTDIRWLVEGGYESIPPDPRDGFWFDCPTNTLVIEHADGLFLVDTSCPQDWKQRWKACGADKESPYTADCAHPFFETSIARLGYRMSDFDAVIFTHLHFDHAGNAPLFADLPVSLIVHRDELAAFSAADDASATGYVAADLDGIAAERFDQVTGDQELVPGISLLELPGHSAGTMGVMVQLERTGPVLYTGDAAHMEISYRGDGRPDPGAWSADAWARSAARLRAFEREGVRILCSHDPGQLEHDWALAPHYHD
jgi:N-acyl homoserine lactone hydrolase